MIKNVQEENVPLLHGIVTSSLKTLFKLFRVNLKIYLLEL